MRSGRCVVALLSVVALGSVAVACSSESSTDEAESSRDAKPEEGQAQQPCSREQLRSVATDFLDALAKDGDPSRLPLSPELRYTENGEQIEPGEGFWQTAGATRFQRNVLDTETCGTHTQAVVDEDGADVIFGVRLLVQDDEITEIETYITREDDYWFYHPQGLLEADEAITAEVDWEELVPEERRVTREELIDLADGYFESFGDEVLVPMDNQCYRLENGLRTSGGDCGAGLDRVCPELVTQRRYPLIDVEAGIAVAYVLFGRALDFHMFKVVDGEIRLIDALVTASDYDSSGWEEEEPAAPPISECP